VNDQDMVVLIQAMLHYLGPTNTVPDAVDVEATVQRFRKMHPEYSVAHSPKEDALKR
jgi:hypothetical protein